MEKNITKRIIFGLIIVVAAVGITYGIRFIKERRSPEYQVMQYFKNLEEQYRNDPYGGSTPEETLQLFIDALKKGDVELAAKYFSIEEQKKEEESLNKVKGSGKLAEVTNRLQQFKLSKKDSVSASFIILDEKGVLKYQASLSKGPNGKWKISDL